MQPIARRIPVKRCCAASLLCLTAGAALADGDGPFGVPQISNSLPPGFLAGTAQYRGEQSTNQYFAAQAVRHGTGSETVVATGSTDSTHSPR